MPSRLFWYAVCESLGVVGMAVYVISFERDGVRLTIDQFAGVHSANLLYQDRSSVQSIRYLDLYLPSTIWRDKIIR